MGKFTWKNGTLVEPAKVTVGGEVLEVTPAQYEGETPLSAANLNSMQDGIYEDMDAKAKRKVATIYNATDLKGWQEGKLLLKDITSNSEELTLSKGGIKIGKNIKTILVSANVFGHSSETNKYLWTQTRKNENIISISLSNATSQFTSTAHAPKMVDVDEGDIISIYKVNGDAMDIRGNANTYLTVEVIE